MYGCEWVLLLSLTGRRRLSCRFYQQPARKDGSQTSRRSFPSRGSSVESFRSANPTIPESQQEENMHMNITNTTSNPNPSSGHSPRKKTKSVDRFEELASQNHADPEAEHHASTPTSTSAAPTPPHSAGGKLLNSSASLSASLNFNFDELSPIREMLEINAALGAGLAGSTELPTSTSGSPSQRGDDEDALKATDNMNTSTEKLNNDVFQPDSTAPTQNSSVRPRRRHSELGDTLPGQLKSAPDPLLMFRTPSAPVPLSSAAKKSRRQLRALLSRR